MCWESEKMQKLKKKKKNPSPQTHVLNFSAGKSLD